MDRFRRPSQEAPDQPDWVREAEEAEQQLILPGDRIRFNRQRLFEELPRLEAFYIDGHMELPDELPDLDEAEMEELVARLPETELPEMIRLVGRHRLGEYEWVRLRHPRNGGFETQLHEEHGRLYISTLEDQEYTENGHRWRRRIRFTEAADGGFRHEDTVMLIEEQPELPEPPTADTEPPATRLDLISILRLLVESDVIHQERRS